jgi:hypothetical protein
MRDHEPRKAGARYFTAQSAYAAEVVHSVCFITRQGSGIREQGSEHQGAIFLIFKGMDLLTGFGYAIGDFAIAAAPFN